MVLGVVGLHSVVLVNAAGVGSGLAGFCKVGGLSVVLGHESGIVGIQPV